MLEFVRFQNYRFFRAVDLPLGRFTVLVGPNATGKSTLLRIVAPEDRQPRFLSSDVSAGATEGVITHALMVGQNRATYMNSYPATKPAVTPLPYSSQLLHLGLIELRAENTLEAAGQLQRDGSNLTNFFASLSRPQQEAASKEICRLAPVFQDVAARPTTNGRHHLVFQDRWRPEIWYPPPAVSDGTMLLTALVLLRFQSPVPQLIAIEEPERGLHPWLLREVVSLLRRLATGELGGPAIQVVLATQSAELLSYVEPDDVRFISRHPDTGDAIIERAPVGTEGWAEAYRNYDSSLPSMWLAGGLGGVPGR